jgi:hypothetical protein
MFSHCKRQNPNIGLLRKFESRRQLENRVVQFEFPWGPDVRVLVEKKGGVVQNVRGEIRCQKIRLRDVRESRGISAGIIRL